MKFWFSSCTKAKAVSNTKHDQDSHHMEMLIRLFCLGKTVHSDLQAEIPSVIFLESLIQS